MNGNKRGEIVNPSITLSVLNRFDEEIAPGVSVRVDDPLRFRIALNISGNRRKFMEMSAADHVKAYSHQTRHRQDYFVVSGVVSDFFYWIFNLTHARHAGSSAVGASIERRRRERCRGTARRHQQQKQAPSSVERRRSASAGLPAPAALERLSNGRWRHDSKHTAVE